MKKLLIFIISFLIITLIGFLFLYLKTEIIIKIDLKSPHYVNINDNFETPKAEALYCKKYFKKSCINITEHLNTSNNINTTNLGNYNLTYSIKYKNLKKTIDFEIIVTDLESPTITLDNNEIKYLCPKHNLEDIKNYTVIDNFDLDIQNKLTKYIKDNKLYYTVTDSHGNKAEISIDIELKDNEAPNIILNGYQDIYLLQGSTYKDPGFTTYDNCDGNLTSKTNISGQVDTNVIGDYKISYSVKDSSGNNQTKTRIVHVYNSSIGENVKKNGKKVYLTFDDGPNSYTKNILDVLDKYNIKATFFVTNQFPRYQSVIKDIAASGHSLAIHSYSHQYKTIYKNEDSYFSDLEKMDKVIFDQTGINSKLIRFPGGSSNTISKFNVGIMTRLSKLLKEKGYVYFDWNVDSGDTSTINSEKIANNVINGIKKHTNSVVLMHDIKYANKDALDKIIYYGLTNGYTFLPLDENSPTAHHSIKN